MPSPNMHRSFVHNSMLHVLHPDLPGAVTDEFCQWCLQIDLVVATPKRLSHLLKAKQVDLSSVQFLILDEADKLFELGFVSHIDSIIHACSNPNIVRFLSSVDMFALHSLCCRQ